MDQFLETTKTYTHKNLHVNVNSNFTNNCQNMEATKRSLKRLINKLILPYNWKLFCKKIGGREQGMLNQVTKDMEDFKCILVGSQLEKAIYYMTPIIWHSAFWKRWNSGDDKQNSGCQGAHRVGRVRAE